MVGGVGGMYKSIEKLIPSPLSQMGKLRKVGGEGNSLTSLLTSANIDRCDKQRGGGKEQAKHFN